MTKNFDIDELGAAWERRDVHIASRELVDEEELRTLIGHRPARVVQWRRWSAAAGVAMALGLAVTLWLAKPWDRPTQAGLLAMAEPSLTEPWAVSSATCCKSAVPEKNSIPGKAVDFGGCLTAEAAATARLTSAAERQSTAAASAANPDCVTLDCADLIRYSSSHVERVEDIVADCLVRTDTLSAFDYQPCTGVAFCLAALTVDCNGISLHR